MASETKPQIDSVTGTATTGHEWDGLQELNTPLPRWWLWLFYVTIIWSIGYWIVYPSWPLISSYTAGTFGWNSRSALRTDMAALTAQRGPLMEKLGQASLAEIAADRSLSDFARAVGKPAFAENCAPCHGSGGGGAKGYPNLVDDEWLWGGKLDDIALTIRHGVRAADDKTRMGPVMPAFGRDGILSPGDISTVADYVRNLARLPVQNFDLDKGKKIFAENCVVCHGDDGKGKRDVGAPNLTDAVWLYGSGKDAIVEGLMYGRGGMMPAWGARLDDTTIKALTIYVQSFGGGEK